jgi:hypothetical protein
MFSVRMGTKRLDSVADLVRHGLNAQIECGRCRRVVIMPAARLRDQCFTRSIPLKLDMVARHLRCSCGHRGARIDPTGNYPTCAP